MPNSLSFNVISYLRLASNPAKESWKRFVNVALIIGFQLGILADYPAEASMDNNSGENVLSSNKLITRGKRRGIPAKIDLEWQHLAYRILLLTGWLPLPQKSVIRSNDASHFAARSVPAIAPFNRGPRSFVLSYLAHLSRVHSAVVPEGTAGNRNGSLSPGSYDI